MNRSEIWTVLKHTFTPRNIPLEKLAESIDQRTDEVLRKSGMVAAIHELTRGKGSSS
jgi:hypothetical protein